MVEEETKSQGIQSIEVGIDMLKKMAEAGKPLSITEIAILCDTSKSKLHRYLTSFVRTGMVEKNTDAKYTLGTEIIRLGLKASQKLNITEIAAPHLKHVKEALNETVALALWGENGPFFVSWEESNGPVNIGVKVGSQVSVTKSAAGLVFAAFLPEDEIEQTVNKELFQFSIDSEEFQNTIEFVKKNGYAFVKGTTIAGISGIAAPIFDRSSKLIATLTIVGFEGSLNTSESSEAVRILIERSTMISEFLGWNSNYTGFI